MLINYRGKDATLQGDMQYGQVLLKSNFEERGKINIPDNKEQKQCILDPGNSMNFIVVSHKEELQSIDSSQQLLPQFHKR